MTPLKKDLPRPSCSHSYLLVMRVWREETGDHGFEWRAHVQHVHGGGACYIRRWQDLVQFLNTLEETEKLE